MNNNGWGGARKGSGRKKVFATKKNINITVSDDMYKFLLRQGNISGYIRNLIEQEM